MRPSTSSPRLLAVALSLLSCVAAAQGYQLQQHEPTAAGEPFFAVRSPQYDPAHALAVGLTLNYGHNPLLGGRLDASGRFVRERVVISNQLLGHLDVAGVLFGRLQLSASLPLTLLERGLGGYGVSPVGGVVAGDPRVGARVRLLGEDRGPFGLHLGGDLWIPIGVADQHAGDTAVRGGLGLILDGRASPNVIWAVNAGALLRPRASLTRTSSGPGTTGPALQAGAAAAWTSSDDVWRVGPELVFSTGLTDDALTPSSTRLEALLGGGWRIGGIVDVGPAIGVGIVKSAGTPDFRALLRVAVLPFGGAGRDSGRDDATSDEDEADDASTRRDAEQDKAARDGQDAQQDDSAHDAHAEDAAEGEPQAPADDAVDDDAARSEEAASASDEAAPVAKTEPPPAPVEVRDERPSQAPAQTPSDAVISTVTFETDSDQLTAESEVDLDRAIAFLRDHPQSQLHLAGHGDSRGPERWNQTLSELRAKSAKRELVRRGVRAARIDVTGHGSSQPVADNATAAGRAQNRRVEVRSAE